MRKLRNVLKHLGVISSSDLDIVASEQKTKELYEEAAATGKAPGKTCKIQILGDERAGKTSLRKRLMGEQFDPKEPPTFGIDTHFCKVNDVDETWRERREKIGKEYDRVISWVLANALRKWNNSTESSVTSEPKRSQILTKLLNVIISSLSLFAMCSVILLNFALSSFITSSTFCNIVVLVSALSVLATNKSDIYRVGVGLALLVPLAHVLFGILFNNATNDKTEVDLDVKRFSVSTSLVTLWLPCATCLYGFICGFGFRTGVTAGVLTVITPTSHSSWQDHTSYQEILKVLFGMGCGLNFVVLCSSIVPSMLDKVFFNYLYIQKRVGIFTRFALGLPGVILSLLACIQYIKDAPLFLHGFLLGVGIMVGLFLGRWLAVNYAYENDSEKLFFGLVVGIATTYLSGYRIPLIHEDGLDMVNVLLRLTPLTSVEIYRRFVNRNNPAPIQMVSNKLAKNTDTLPIKLSIWDFAGQEFYYNTHHTFMAPDAVYIIVFDLYKFKQESLRARELNRIKFWMKSVHQHANSPIFLVGTHLDCVDGKDLVQVSEYLHVNLLSHNYTFLQKLVLNKNFPFFAIDNSGTLNKSSGLQDNTAILRDTIREKTEKAKAMTQEYPIRWRHFLDLVQRKHESSSPSLTIHEPFISISNLKGVLDDCGFSDIKEINEMLDFFHDSGEIIYDSVDNILRQFIILQPQFLVDVMESIVDLPQSNTLGKLSQAASRLQTTGVLEHDLAKFLVTRKVQIVDESNLGLVLSMLEAKDLLCKVHLEPAFSDTANRFDGENKLLYVVPSMLPEGQPVLSVSVEWDVRYYLDFGPLLADAVLFRLMARCSSHSNLLCQGTNQCALFREGGLFTLGAQFFFMLRKQKPCTDQEIIEVSVKATPESNPIDVLRYLHNIMETLRCRDFRRLRYHVGIRCSHPAPHQGCTPDMWHIIHLCGSGDTMFPEEREIHRLCNGRLVDVDIYDAVSKTMQRFMQLGDRTMSNRSYKICTHVTY